MSFRIEICEILIHNIIVFTVYTNRILYINLKVFRSCFCHSCGDAELLDLTLQMLFPKKLYQLLVIKPKTSNYSLHHGNDVYFMMTGVPDLC